ncbi:MAG: STAS-like domain-containing protein [Desulfovibrio sp.]
MGTIKITDHLNRWLTNEDGAVIFEQIRPYLEKDEPVVVSFEGVSSVPTSFVNSAFLELLVSFPFSKIKEKLTFVHTNRQINAIINKRFQFVVNQQRDTPTH